MWIHQSLSLFKHTLNHSRYLLIALTVTLLSACDSGQGDDLDKFIRESGKDMRVKIPPIPEVKAYFPVDYNPDGSLADPFKPRKAVSKGGTSEPDLSRPRDPLEAFPLQSLQYVGLLTNAKQKYALIKTPENITQQVKVGGYMGQNFGKVTEITESEIKLKETVQDDATGDWVEHATSINLQE
jgi:type IV pilus assembly protein PilP